MPSSGSKSGEIAPTACEKHMTNRGKFTEHGTADGQTIAIPFQGMDVELPIASVQKSVKSGNAVMFHEDGGEMKNRQTGNTIRIHGIEGVYYIKMEVSDVPDAQPTACDNKCCAMQKPEEFPRRRR